MGEDTIRKIEKYIQNMPSLPTTVSKVLEVCNNPQTSPADLNHVISLDPVLVGRVLKLINSAYYGLGQQVTSLVRAIIMLGINTVKNLALSSAVLGNLASKKEFHAINPEGFWRHSLCVGVTAKMLAKKRGIDPKLMEEYFTAGLLHDIGKIPLNAVLGESYIVAMSVSDRERIPLYKAEEATLGINHCASGAMIVDAWKLEGAVGDSIVFHHMHTNYDGPHRDVLFSVVAANWFANAMEIGFSGDRYPDKTDPMVWDFLGITRDVFDDLEGSVNQEIEKAQIFLRV
ncbi:HDOD domain-containing protein [Breznakiella homolactica]|uniref:HDOD domain-containing protein n=1 Tax=Breznakiella homolactica TaxID=2798577 RepID=A0A7T8BBQ7_9SPIR|nr:HDOD domain-containing protein [Breznakiella homolactica]QQO09453.1 HDOD domain-containing protein [Breznakiella homolactica]